MYCPECGSDAADAKFCPECGNDLTYMRRDASRPSPASARSAAQRPAPRSSAQSAVSRWRPPANRRRGRQRQPAAPQPRRDQPRQQRRQAARRAERREGGGARAGGQAEPRQEPRDLHLGRLRRGRRGRSSHHRRARRRRRGRARRAPPPTCSAAVTADTAGSYTELVTRANGLYDQGSAAFSNNDTTGGQKYFAAAAKVYAAAWKKQAGDPGVGTDYATSLFYSGQTDKAIRQVNEVLAADAGFQTAYLNKGIFLKAQSTDAKDAGDSATADKLLAGARAAFEKAVSLDASSDTGKRATEELQSL